ncbi:hypothetical protein [Kitasatospora sp. NBC_00039]|uniref:hypothetical protein n=1 Tax=Kitasatospora sp. NBC_00039 TaxID=2903565 RepID=UPI00324EC747
MAHRNSPKSTGHRALLRGLAGGVLGAFVAATAIVPGHGAALTALPPGTQFTPLTAAVLTEPAPFDATDGKVHLSYELLRSRCRTDSDGCVSAGQA